MDPPKFDRADSYGLYSGGLRKLVHLLKYERIEPLAKPLAKRLWESIDGPLEADLLIPVPMHWRRRWTRRFNQAALVAGELARLSGIRVDTRALRRTKPTPPQAGLSRVKRKKNLRGAFHVKQPGRVNGLRIAVVDDVMTTGATLSECARALKAAGAQSVTALTIARAELASGRI